MTAIDGVTLGPQQGDGVGLITLADGPSDARAYVESLPTSSGMGDEGFGEETFVGPDEWATVIFNRTGQETNSWRVSKRAFKKLAGTLVTPPAFTGGTYL